MSLLCKPLGLFMRSFCAPLYRLFSLPTFLEIALPHTLCLFDTLSLHQHADIVWMAGQFPASDCADWVYLVERRDGIAPATPWVLVNACLDMFWALNSLGSRH